MDWCGVQVKSFKPTSQYEKSALLWGIMQMYCLLYQALPPTIHIDLAAMEDQASKSHWGWMFGLQPASHPVALSESKKTFGMSMVEDKELLAVMHKAGFDFRRDGIEDFEKEMSQQLGDLENENIQAYIQTQGSSEEMRANVANAESHVFQIELLISQLEKAVISRPRRDLEVFEKKNHQLKVVARNQNALAGVLQSFLSKLELSEEEIDILKEPFNDDGPRDLELIVRTMKKLTDAQDREGPHGSGLERLNISVERIDEFARHSRKLRDATETFMVKQFQLLAERTMAEPIDIDTEMTAWLEPSAMYNGSNFANKGIHEGLMPWTPFMQGLRLLEEKKKKS